MTVSPRKRVSIVGTRSLRGAKATVTEDDWVAGSGYTFKGSPELSPNKGATKKKATPKAKGRRQSLLLKRLEVQDNGNKLSPIMSRRSRRTSMINISSQKTVVTETTKIVRSTSDKVLPTRPRGRPSNKTIATKALPPKGPASKAITPKSPPVKPASPVLSPKEPSPKNLKKKEVSTKVTVKSATKMTKTVSKTSTRRASAVKSPISKSPLQASPKEISPKNTKVSIKTIAKSTKTTKSTKAESKIEAKYSSPEAAKPKEITFSPVKFYSSPKKSQTPLKRKSLVMSVDQDVSFNYSPVSNKKRKFDGTPTPEADSEKKSKKRKIDRSSVKSRLPVLEKKDIASKETPKSANSARATQSKTIVKTSKEESSAKSPNQAQVKTPKESIIKSPILGRKSAKKLVVVLSPLIKAKSPKKKSPTKTPDAKVNVPKSNKKSTVKKTPESRKSIRSSTKKPTPSPKVVPESRKSIKSSVKKPTPSPKVSQQKKVRSVTKTAKKVQISATSPEASLMEYRKTPRSEKQKKADTVSDVGASPELNSAAKLLATIRASPIKSKAKLQPFTPKPDPTPSRVLKHTMKKKAAKDLQALKNIKTSSLVDSELVVIKTPVQLTRTPLRKVSAVSPETPSSASNLPPTPTSSRKTLTARRGKSVAARELNISPPRSSTPIEGESSPEPQIPDPDVTDINVDLQTVKEISATITTTEVITTEVTSTSQDGEINGITTAIVSEEQTEIVSGDISMSSELNGSALSVADDSQENPPSKSRWRYCSVM